MVRLKKKGVVFADTPLVEGLYVAECGSLLQIRLKESQIVMSAVSTYEDLVRCGKLLVERYRTVENLRKRLTDSDYAGRIPKQEFLRRQSEESSALKSNLYKNWYKELTEDSVEETVVVKKNRPKVGIKLKKVAKGVRPVV